MTRHFGAQDQAERGLTPSVTLVLNRGMGERLTYGIPARYCVVLVERLGGLFFAGRRSCIEVSFAGHSGLYCGDGEYSCLCVILGRRALNGSMLLLVTAYLS